ncbi:MAG: FAD-dependent oxidoreductase, partial [Pseudomonadota bacterium]
VGGGIGGLTAAIALRRQGYAVEIIERDPEWTVYGVGIIQQMNVVRAMKQIDVLDDYVEKSFGFDKVSTFVGPQGMAVPPAETPRLAGPEYPSNAGIRRTDLQAVLGNAVKAAGADLRLGVTVDSFVDDGDGVDVTFSDGQSKRYDIVIGADGLFSQMREAILPDAPKPRYTGQWVWRYNLPRPAELDGIHLYAGPCNAGLVPMSEDLMYMFLVSEEPENTWLETEGAAEKMRARSQMAPEALKPWVAQITDDAGVVARPMDVIFLKDDPWHKGRVVLIGDAVHASTPHLAQGAGMAIEDGIVLAEEMTKATTAEAAFSAYRDRRYKRVSHVALNSELIGDYQMGKVKDLDPAVLNVETIKMMCEPI